MSHEITAPGDLATPGAEPDEVPTRAILALAGALTVFVVVMVAFTLAYFRYATAAELKAKGYEERASASFGAEGEAATPEGGR